MKIKGLVFLLALGGCITLTPLSQTEITELTTCNNKTLSEIKKNLMLQGFTISKTDEDSIQTDFKQVDGWSSSKSFIGYSIVKMSDKSARFVVREKTSEMRVVNTGGSSITSGKGQNQTTISSTQGQAVNDENERTQTEYYAERREAYLARRAQVCGQ